VKGSLIIVAFFAGGVGIGLLGTSGMAEGWTAWALYPLMVLIGVEVGADERSLAAVRKAGAKVLLVPLAVALGSLVGAAALWPVLSGSMSMSHLLSVGAGFGYYSLSSVIISKHGYSDIAAVALMSNMTREIVTLVGTPLMARWFGRLAPVASGGATAMDTTLPIITEHSGHAFLIVALVSGFVLTMLVPILVPLLLGIPI
jgi:uncharacterized membrane protein YbjE (DUF340 family)